MYVYIRSDVLSDDFVTRASRILTKRLFCSERDVDCGACGPQGRQTYIIKYDI